MRFQSGVWGMSPGGTCFGIVDTWNYPNKRRSNSSFRNYRGQGFGIRELSHFWILLFLMTQLPVSRGCGCVFFKVSMQKLLAS